MLLGQAERNGTRKNTNGKIIRETQMIMEVLNRTTILKTVMMVMDKEEIKMALGANTDEIRKNLEMEIHTAMMVTATDMIQLAWILTTGADMGIPE